jgi:hypothetical protein
VNDAPANLDSKTVAHPTGVRSAAWLRALWAVNIIAFFFLAVWVFTDGRFSDAASELWSKPFRDGRPGATTFPGPWYVGRVMLLRLAGVLVIASTVGIFFGLFFGAPQHRRVRSWLVFTLLAAAWLTLFATWGELAWRGQMLRLSDRLVGFETIAADLRSDWPDNDGERPHLGPFMAYPIGRPRMLMMLTAPAVPGSSTSFASVERSADGALHFELVGDEPGAWLEWHPTGSAPQSFVGGLQNQYPLERYSTLGNGWFLARYKPSYRIRNLSPAPPSSPTK